MKMPTLIAKITWPKTIARRLPTAWASRLLPLLLLLALPAVVEAQFDYTNTNGALTITGYTGPGGAVTIPSTINNLPVTSIGDDAFYDCGSLTSVTIPDSVTSIGEEAFTFCTSLISVAIPGSVTSIGAGPFCGCTSLTAVTVDAANLSYSSAAGVLFDKTQTTLIQYPLGQTGPSYTIPNRVTSIGDYAFAGCSSLTSVYFQGDAPSVGSSVFTGDSHATACYLLGTTGWATTFGGRPSFLWDPLSQATYTITSGTVTITGYTGPSGAVIIPSTIDGLPATSIGLGAFMGYTSLTSVTIPDSVTSIGDYAFAGCSSLANVYFQGNAPNADSSVFCADRNATVYYLPGTTGWGPTFGGRPTTLSLPPSILTPPSTQTAEMGSLAEFWVEVTSTLPGTTYQWYVSGTNALGATINWYLVLANVQPVQAGAYTVVVTNLWGAVTSAPAWLSVIPPVERRIVPALNLTGDVGSFLRLDYVNAFGPGAQWLSLTNFTLTSTPQLCFDLSDPLPAQRFYRAWQTNAPSARPVLDPRLATEIPLTGATGSSVRIDYINQFGPTNAWVTLDTVTLTNSPQLYFDVTMFRQPTRLYRLVAVP